MKSLMRLWQELANELASWCDTSAHLDVDCVRRRVEHEGISFLTITLPDFGSDFERSLDRGLVSSDCFAGFQRSRGLPKFLSGFLRQVFDATSGVLLEDPSVDAIFAVRQLTLVYKKIFIKCTPEREAQALETFISCEHDVKLALWSYSDFEADFKRVKSLMFNHVFRVIEDEVNDFAIEPAHGPGSTADRKIGNQKFVQSEWTERLEEFFPFLEYVLPNHRYHELLDHVDFVPPERERPVKVTLVPKTLKTPRVIAIEPTCMQYMQQGLMRTLVPKLENRFPGSSFIGFTDQSLNQDMAREGSLYGELATLDLSEASDRVSNELVMWLTDGYPDLQGAIQSARSRVAKLPDGRLINLQKFASMGSALCFPLEAMVFLTIIFLGIEQSQGRLMTRNGIQSLRGQVRVYGDDIIVPVEHVDSVVRNLELFGLKVNTRKSFWSGKFRESCGGDYYDGQDVTPIRLKVVPPSHRAEAAECVSYSSFGNALHKRGLWKSAEHVHKHMKKVLKGTYPCVPEESDAVGAFSYLGFQSEGYDEELHRPLIKAYRIRIKADENPLDGVFALRKTLTGDWSDPVDAEHLLLSGRSSSVRIKRSWVRV